MGSSDQIRYHNPQYSGGFPLAIGDRFYGQDLFRNFRHGQQAASDLYEEAFGIVDCILRGLECSQGAGHTMDITAGKALVKYNITIPDPSAAWTVPPSTTTKDIYMAVEILSSLTNQSLSSTTTDGVTTNYGKIAYTETNGNSRTRAKKAGTYNYEVYPNYTLTFDAVAPTAYEVEICRFTTDGATITFTGNGDTRLYQKLNYKMIVSSQDQFNAIITRTAANTYKFDDAITNLHLKPLAGGYELTGANSFNTGGDTGINTLETNNVVKLTAEYGAYLTAPLYDATFKVNTDYAYIEGIVVKTGHSSGATATKILNSASYVTFVKCGIEDMDLSTSATAADMIDGGSDLYSAYYECFIQISAFPTSGGLTFNGFLSCYNMFNCQVYDWDMNKNIAHSLRGFQGCQYLSNCTVYNIAHSGAGGSGANISGFRGCSFMSNCVVDTITGNLVGSGYAFESCNNLSNCYAKDVGSFLAANDGFLSCDYLSSCRSYSNTGSGFKTCDNVSACRSESNNHGYESCVGLSSCLALNSTTDGFNDCDNIAACQATGNGGDGFDTCENVVGSYAQGNTGYGFNGCKPIQTNYAVGNTAGQYNNSFADRAGGQAAADTATGGYNG